ncbi:MAG: penicillin-binding transpeptidase domain-containing protein [Eubacteriales bacterium]|nr:penicillin-binding transpeptidase domain-containing protein [Clostridiales bacterium]MDY5835613.1 penicillin-binding transpeptidase domain-containing protein [Eubacteriales bacterium]
MPIWTFVRIWALLVLFLSCGLLAACGPQDIIKDGPKPSASVSQQGDNRPDPQDTVNRVIAALQADDTRSLLKDIYPLSLEKYGEAQIVDRNAKIHQDLGIQEIRYDKLVPTEDVSKTGQIFYSADLHLRGKYGDISGPVLLSFIWHPDAQAWQLEWTPSLILPGLKATGEVQVESLPAVRGEIIDRAGWPLAVNRSLAQVSLVPRDFDLSKIAEVNALLGLEPGTIEAKLAQAWVKEDSLVPIALVADMQKIDYKTFHSLGLSWAERTSRYYPFKQATAQLIGYVGPPSAEDLANPDLAELTDEDLIGKTGLEAIYDKSLRGKPGIRVYISGQYEKSLYEQPAQDGQDLRLTLDAIAQRDLYERVKGENLVLSGLDPASGQILVLLSSPSYDPNDFVLGISQEAYNALAQNPQQPLSPAFAGATSPGSTQKLATAIIALRSGKWTLDDKMYIEGKEWQLDDSWGNYQVTRFRELDQEFDLEEALVYSDNIFFARLASDLGSETFNAGMHELGLGRTLTQDYPFALSQISNHGDLGPEESVLLADSAYGQGEVLYTPIHLAEIYASLLNGGRLLPLSLILPDTPLAANPQDQGIKLLEEDEIETLRQALRRVVTDQYAKQMTRANLELAGKSGTAELGLDDEGQQMINSWFVGYDQKQAQIVLAQTFYQAQKFDDPYRSHALYADYMSQLAGDKGYQVPSINLDKTYDPDDIPAFRLYQAPLEEEAEETKEED